jgi:hypothetical protein
MDALANNATITRFSHYDEETNDIYIGEIETDHDGCITILSCWCLNTTIQEAYPYDRKFPALLRAAIEQTAIEQRFSPPATPIELPSDWEEISIKSTETTYEIETKLQLPTVMSDLFRERVGLRAVRRIAPTTSNGYRVTVRGSFAEMRRELRRAAALTA